MRNPMNDPDLSARAEVVIEKLAARYARRLHTDAATHDDLRQDGWAAIMADARGFKPAKGTWEKYVKVVVGAAMRRSLYVQRAPVSGSAWRAHRWSEGLRGVDVDPEAHASLRSASAEHLMIGSQFLRALVELLHNIAGVVPGGALAMRVALGETPTEVARAEGVSVATVMRAVKAFREAVNDNALLGTFLGDSEHD